MAEQSITWIAQKATWGIDRKSLTRRPTNKHVKFTRLQAQTLSYFGWVDSLNGTTVRKSFRVIELEGLDCLWHYIVTIKAHITSLPETLGNSSGPTKQINCA
ncbi:hypothetical protein A0O30_17225 [Pseudomonas sp. LLC-1]|nr:hypothetical protein A0O30_17225 [Pseudomonas sp. LLC-1]